MSGTQYYSISSSYVSGGGYACSVNPMDFSKFISVLYSTSNVTFSAVGQSATYNMPTFLFGSSYSAGIITGVTCRIVSGGAGSLATFGVTAAGTSLFTGKTLPSTSTNLCLVNCSNTYNSVNPQDPLVFSVGGVVSGTGVFQFDVMGYYFL